MSSCVLRPEPGNLTPVRDSPAIPRLRSVNSYTNIRAATTARNLNKSLQNLNLNEEGKREKECWGKNKNSERESFILNLDKTVEDKLELA